MGDHKIKECLSPSIEVRAALYGILQVGITANYK